MEVDILSIRLEETLRKLNKVILFLMRDCVRAFEACSQMSELTEDPQKLSVVKTRLIMKKGQVERALKAEKLICSTLLALSMGDLSVREHLEENIEALEALFLEVPDCFT